MRSTRIAGALAGLVALAWPAAAEAPTWSVEAEDSRVGFAVEAGGQTVRGAFESYRASIAFDPEHPETSRLEVVIDVASVETGSTDQNAMIRSPDLFDAETFPTATFRSTAVRETEAGYEAEGELTLRDRTLPVRLPFTLEIEGDEARAEGSLPVSRLDYGVGRGQWADTSIVAEEVTIEIAVRASLEAP